MSGSELHKDSLEPSDCLSTIASIDQVGNWIKFFLYQAVKWGSSYQVAELVVLGDLDPCHLVLHDVTVQVENQSAGFFVEAQVLNLKESLEEVEHVLDALVGEMVFLGTSGSLFARGKLDAVDDADKAVKHALAQLVEMLLFLNWERCVNWLKAHLTCANEDIHGLVEVWSEGMLRCQTDVADGCDTKDLYL